MSKIPDFNLIAHEGDLVCDECNEETIFAIGNDSGSKFYCNECFTSIRPEYTEALVDFSQLVDLMIELKNSKMSLEEMYELYGDTPLED